MSMRSRITATFAACIALPLAAGWCALWFAAEHTVRHQAADALQAETRAVMASIETRLSSNLTHLKAWSSMPMMQEVLIDDDGGELAQVLVDLNRAYPDFASLTITNARGLVVATTDAALRKADLTDAAGIQEAISGRATQSTFERLRAGTAEAIRYTAPLVAVYDRQTVIGTITGVIDLGQLATGSLVQSRLLQERRVFVLARQDDNTVVFANRHLDLIAPLTRSLAQARPGQKRDLSLAGEPGSVVIARSGSRALEPDPELVAIAFEPTAAVLATASKVSDIFLGVTGLAALAALLMAWRWAAPLARAATAINPLPSGKRHASPPARRGQPTFGPIIDALARLNAAEAEREDLRGRVQSLAAALAEARLHAGMAADRLQSIGDTLKDRMDAVTQLIELINRENLAAAASRRQQTHLPELNRSAMDLLKAIRDAIEASHDDKADSATSVPDSTRLSA